MHIESRVSRKSPRTTAGFGLVDALVALALLAVTLLGACGALHFALRATRAAAWQARAVDLVADLGEELSADLYHADATLPFAVRLESWRGRLRHELPAADLLALDPRSLPVGETITGWIDLRLAWSALPGKPRDTLRLPIPQAHPP